MAGGEEGDALCKGPQAFIKLILADMNAFRRRKRLFRCGDGVVSARSDQITPEYLLFACASSKSVPKDSFQLQKIKF